MVVTVLPMMRRTGEVAGLAVVDYEDFAWASAFRWSLSAQGYAVRKVGGRKGRVVKLHREILGLDVGEPLQGDHVNRNRLDYRRCNLRVVTHAENARNLRPKGGTSRHRGVDWDASRQRWRAQACGRFLGRFGSEEEAARVAREWRLRHAPGAVD